jgi:hypothetical protein
MINEFWVRPFDDANYYYQVGNQKTYNKNIAVALANGDVNKIHLYWMDDLWSSIDVTVRPTQSWRELMTKRCWQVRDQASEVGIGFSGGYDCQTILDYFVLNNIKLDYLLIHNKTFVNYPETFSALETAKKIKKDFYPNLKIYMPEFGIESLLNFYKNKKDDWLWSSSVSEFRFTKHSRSTLINYNHDHSKLCLNNKKITIEGREKPRLFIENGWWVIAMHDGVFSMTFNTPFEDFYISKDLPELHLQQVWMMIDWLESQPIYSISLLEELLHKVQKSLDNVLNEQWNLAVGRNKVHHVHSWDLLGTNYKHQLSGGMYSSDTIRVLNDHPSLKLSSEFKVWESTSLEFYKNYKNAFVYSEDYNQFGTVSDQENAKDINFALQKNIWTKKYPIKPVEPGCGRNQLIKHKL